MMLDFAYSKTCCKSCAKKYVKKKPQVEYMRDYMKTARWLDGSNDNFLLGEK